jgi:aldose 1-epimerase
VDIINYGCTVVSITVPDRLGIRKNIVAGFDDLQQYLQVHPYFGCVIGRYANRIAFGKFRIDGIEYALSVNDPPNHLHGGFKGFDKKVWQVANTIEESHRTGISLSYSGKDGEEGYPGNLKAVVTYFLTEENKLHIQYSATTDKPTIVNLTNHSYFNLTAFEEQTVYNHQLRILADNYLVKNEYNVPSGEIASVKDGIMDFTTTKQIGTHINLFPKDRGYDHTYVVNKQNHEVELAAELLDPGSGRLLRVFTDQPGIQVYTANWWDGSLKHSSGNAYHKHAAIALEAQAFPDAPNHPNFPNTILRPGETYRATTIFQFLVD